MLWNRAAHFSFFFFLESTPCGISQIFRNVYATRPLRTIKPRSAKFLKNARWKTFDMWANFNHKNLTSLPSQLSWRWLCETARLKLLSWSSVYKFHSPSWRRNASVPRRSPGPGTPPCLRSGCRGCTWAARCSSAWRTWCICSCCWDPETGTPCRRAPQSRSCSVHSVCRKPLRTKTDQEEDSERKPMNDSRCCCDKNIHRWNRIFIKLYI